MTTTNPNRENSPGAISPVDVPLAQLPVVDLNSEHISRSRELAIDRNRSYRAINGGSVYGSNDSLTSHEIGLLGEMAVAEIYATDIDTETYSMGDGGIDTNLWGRSVDVKCSATEAMTYPQLLVCGDSDLSADLYFQTHIVEWGSDGAQVRVLGYARRAQVGDRTAIPHPGETRNYVVEPRELSLPPLVESCNV